LFIYNFITVEQEKMTSTLYKKSLSVADCRYKVKKNCNYVLIDN